MHWNRLSPKMVLMLSRGGCVNSSPPKCSIYASLNWVTICLGNGLSPVRGQALAWIGTAFWLIWILGTNCSEIRINMQNFSIMKMHLKMSYEKWQLLSPVGGGGWVEINFVPIFATASPETHYQVNWCQANIWTNAGILLIRRNFREILSKIHTFSFRKMHSKMLSAKWRKFYLCLNVLRLNGVSFFSSKSDQVRLLSPLCFVQYVVILECFINKLNHITQLSYLNP